LHTTPAECAHPLVRPCADHATVPVACGALFASNRPTAPGLKPPSLAAALAAFRCGEVVRYSRPECGHEVEVQCHERAMLHGIDRGGDRFVLKPCLQIVADFVSCKD
jgi:hypothetical protein